MWAKSEIYPVIKDKRNIYALVRFFSLFAKEKLQRTIISSLFLIMVNWELLRIEDITIVVVLYILNREQGNMKE